MKYLRPLFDPEESLGLYILGTAALTMSIQILYDVSKEPFGLPGAVALAAALIIVAAAVIWLQAVRQQRRRKIDVQESAAVEKHAGLILMISPGNLELARSAFDHHLPELQHCWLVSTPASLSTTAELEKVWRGASPQVQVHSGQEYLVQPEEIEHSYTLVERIYSQEAPLYNLVEEDVLGDVTGGTKPMTAGMALACASPGRNMQYIKTRRDADGNPIKDAPRIPVLISTRRISNQEPGG